MVFDRRSIDPLRAFMTVCGWLSPLVAFTAIFAATWVHRDWFTWTGHALSDLGAVDASPLWIYNVGLVTTGFLGIVFSIRLIDYLESRISQAGALTFLVGMFNLSLVGAFPAGMPHHMTATSLFFLLCTLGMLIVGIGESIRRNRLGMAMVVVVVLGVIAAMKTGQWFQGAAIPELVGAIAYSIFTAGYAARMSDLL